MIFETLYESAQKGELLLIEGGMARFHLRRDGQMTLHEILVTRPGIGIGTMLLNRLRGIARARSASCIVAKCPADLPSNGWYKSKGFCLSATEETPTGRKLNVWRLPL